MRKPISVRELTEAERRELRQALKSGNGVVVRRSQVILLSANEGLKAYEIGARVGYSDQMVRAVLHGFNAKGVTAIYPRSRARHDDQRAFKDAGRDQLKQIVRKSPRDFGCESSLWSLQLLAEVSYQAGLTERLVHRDTVAETLQQLGITWKKAKRHLQSPDANYRTKKNAAIGSNRKLSSAMTGS